MRRVVVILALGALGAALAFGWVYAVATATPRSLMRSATPELAWLKREFGLGDAEFDRIAALHAAYLPKCMERCRQIDRLNGEVARSLSAATEVTPEIERLLEARARIRADCHAEMLAHFFEVGRAMPPEQGRRYLEWVWENTGLREGTMHYGRSGMGMPSPAHP